MDPRVYWIWLQHAFSPGSHKPWLIFNKFQGGVKEFHEGGAPLWNSMRFVTEKEARLLHSFNIHSAEALFEMTLKMKHQIVTPECEKYPEALRNIFDPPAVLYIRGTLPDVDNFPAVTVVGQRKAGERAVNAAITFGYQLALELAVVISGGALGVDSGAHKGALRGMGKTICVLPSGISDGYLIENFALREKIVETGALVSEYPANTAVSKGTFQIRNRLMSGLGCATLIVEPPVGRSGSLITAKLAKEQNRDVFVYPSKPGSKLFAGSEALMRDGAKAVFKAEDILVEYKHRFAKARVMERIKKKPIKIQQKNMEVSFAEPKEEKKVPELKEPLKTVYQILKNSEEKMTHISVVEKQSNLSAAQILSALTQLELSGIIEAHAGRKYSVKN